MLIRPWVYIAALALVASACSAQPEPTEATGSLAAQVKAAQGATARGHLKVLVSYQNGKFDVERVIKSDAPLRTPRSGKLRRGLTYVAEQAGKTVFLGRAPDPRSVHTETPNPVTGELEHREVHAPGKQHFFVYVPEHTELVNFHDRLPTNDTRALAGALPPKAALGRVDLRPYRSGEDRR